MSEPSPVLNGMLSCRQGDKGDEQLLLSGPMARRLADPDAACRDCAVGI